ncbi:MAG: stage V sporulation protein E [Chloroflexi bacterium HGW-Chloroflexi-6]|nr:MAG: stage V sporulation protein E [Chloroflexi bacterium HGW-Chloroflexi-6]
MGTRVFRNTAVAPAEQPQTFSGAVRKLGGSVDLPLLLIMVATLTFGLIMVFSASPDFSLYHHGDPWYIFLRQVLWVFMGTVVAYVLSRIDYHYWRTLILPIMFGTLALLVAVLLVGDERLGSIRGLIEGSIQPSELAKVATVIYLAVWLHSKREQFHDITWGLLPMAVILGMIGGLIYLQPDLSATATVFLLGGLLFFLAGGDLRQILFLFVVALVVGVLVVQVSPTGRDRMGSYLNGIQNPLEASYHVRRSLEAIVKGGWFGVGIGRADTKYLGLPLAATDSIFAVIAEELGILGALGTILLYAGIVWRGIRIAAKAPDVLGNLLATGLTFWLATEAAINILVMVGLMPFAGNALPFISAGGSSMTVSLMAIGILLNVSRQEKPLTAQSERREYGAVLDMRGRNRRRSLSRISRS